MNSETKSTPRGDKEGDILMWLDKLKALGASVVPKQDDCPAVVEVPLFFVVSFLF